MEWSRGPHAGRVAAALPLGGLTGTHGGVRDEAARRDRARGARRAPAPRAWYGLADVARDVFRSLNPHLLSSKAPCDVTSVICQALELGIETARRAFAPEPCDPIPRDAPVAVGAGTSLLTVPANALRTLVPCVESHPMTWRAISLYLPGPLPATSSTRSSNPYLLSHTAPYDARFAVRPGRYRPPPLYRHGF